MRILVIEDDPDLAANLADFLELRGHQPVFAGSLPDGRTVASKRGFDAIILDRLLPGGDGATLSRELRDRGDDTPILMLTALDSVPQRVEGLDAGADDYLVKPFSMSELGARLEALHRRAGLRAEGTTSGPLRLADLEFHPGTLVATRGGQRLELSPTVRKILEYLLRNQHRVVGRAELCRLIWGNSDVDALRAHIHELRLALDRPFDRPLLRTVRGGGWRLMDPGGE